MKVKGAETRRQAIIDELYSGEGEPQYAYYTMPGDPWYEFIIDMSIL